MHKEQPTQSDQEQQRLWSLSLIDAIFKRAPRLAANIFLLYTNVIMTYFAKSSMENPKSLNEIIDDILTPEMFFIAVIGASGALAIEEKLRRK
ncbi:MAG TPA: hypothetical protein VD999_04970 [Vitreimonas sp.]|nr:hypothetical protein [Vitreimonas sp.]